MIIAHKFKQTAI